MFIINTLCNNVYVYKSWEKFCTKDVCSRAEVIFIIYIKRWQRRRWEIQTHFTSKFRLQNLHYNSQELYARTFRCNNRLKQINCYQKNNYISHTFYHTWLIDTCNTPNQQLAVISSDFFWRGGSGFCFLCPS